MKTSDYWLYGKAGLNTLISSLKFFYSRPSLIIIALIPACIRMYQMWNALKTPMWLEAVVEITRVFLCLVMISYLSKVHMKTLRNKRFWKQIATTCSLHLQKHWPHVFLAQIAVFFIGLYAFGNFAITIVVQLSLIPILNVFNIVLSEPRLDAAYQAYIFFLKNISIIPLTIVYMLNMFGVGKSKDEL